MKLLIKVLMVIVPIGIFVTRIADISGVNKFIGISSYTTWTRKKSTKWFNSRKWLNGLKLAPHKSIDQQEFAKQYHRNKAYWDKAFAFMKETDLAGIKPGIYPIDGENVYASITEAPTRVLDSSKWEAHKNYVDLQYVIRGKEQIGVTPLSSLTVVQAYDPSMDIEFHAGEGKYYAAEPGSFFIFFPKDAHRPSLKVEGYEIVKKIVIKVRTGVGK